MNKEDVFKILQDLRDEFDREENRAIRQRSMDKAIEALAGKDAVERLEREIGLRWQMHENIVEMTKRSRK